MFAAESGTKAKIRDRIQTIRRAMTTTRTWSFALKDLEYKHLCQWNLSLKE